MKVLVLCAAYPNLNGQRPMYFVHSRNLYYKKEGWDVTVLNFAAEKGYIYEGISVISLSEYKTCKEKYDVLILHAANIRNHYRFLRKFGYRFPKKVFVFHGHEVLRINKYYPKPYKYMKVNNVMSRLFQEIYDEYKLRVWRKYYRSNTNIRLVFVSKWIMDRFTEEVRVTNEELKGHACVIPNSIGEYFEKNHYVPNTINYDFLSIRSNMDDSKYGVDIINELAINNPQYSFCIIGKGKYYEYNTKPNNVTWISDEMSHERLMDYMNQSRYALLPTREDTQGLMACEMAATGMKLITSDIEVCREVFSDCPSVALINNSKPNIESAIEQLNDIDTITRWTRFFARNTIEREISYIKSYFEKN